MDKYFFIVSVVVILVLTSMINKPKTSIQKCIESVRETEGKSRPITDLLKICKNYNNDIDLVKKKLNILNRKGL